METTSAAVIIAISLVLFGGAYYYFTTRHRERMALIERGLDKGLFDGTPGYLPLILTLGLVGIGIALGITIGAYIETLDFPNAAFAIPVCIFLFLGLSLILSYYLVKRMQRK